jgi:hypothetical protein
MDALSNWTADEILLEHSRTVVWLLHKPKPCSRMVRCGRRVSWRYFMLRFLHRRNGVYMQQRWAGAYDFRDRESDSN